MVKTKYTTTEIRKIVKLLVKTLEASNVIVDKIILYGSYARGTAKDYSDVDLAVISPIFKGKKILDIQAELARICAEYLSALELLGYSSDDYHAAESQTLLGEIKRSGKILYSTRS